MQSNYSIPLSKLMEEFSLESIVMPRSAEEIMIASPEVTKRVYDRMIAEAGVEYLFFNKLTDAEIAKLQASANNPDIDSLICF